MAVVEGREGRRPRVRISSGDLVPTRIPVIEIEVKPAQDGEPAETRWLEGYVWGGRIPGHVESRAVQEWNDSLDRAREAGNEGDKLEQRSRFEGAVLALVDGLTAGEAEVLSNDELWAILDDLHWFDSMRGADGAPPAPAPAPEESSEGAETTSPTTSETC